MTHMESADRITLDDLSDVRKAVAVMRSRSILAAAAGGPIFSAFLATAWLWLHPGGVSVAVVLAVVSYLLFGLPLLVRWILHWRRIHQRLTDVEVRVNAGETVYGSEVRFR
ncbi:hypothetical protein [Stenotrophomonas sp.]|uniref:hypothetical protein n=1 Tax=Stenotrophomonas sp. TaxID=69392 RepID=UPI0028AA529A|nr:hypothetical protein [Stenotrophomonas sp.]